MSRLSHAFAKYRLQWLLLGLSTVLLALSLQHAFNQITELNRRDTNNMAAELRSQFQEMEAFLEAMRGQAEERLRSNPQSILSRHLYQALRVDEGQRLNLDSIPADLPPSLIGNLTGLGPLPAPGSEREATMHLALSLSPLLSTASKLLDEDVAWIYFTGTDNFIYLYPWVPSSQFRFDPSIYRKSYWQDMLTQQPATRHATLSRPYQDFAGRGQMITLSQPIAKAKKVVGMLSIDILLANLERALQQPAPQVGTLFLINQHRQVLARSQPGTAPPLRYGEERDRYHWQQGAFQLVHAIPDTPLTLIHRIPLIALLEALFWQSMTALITLLCLVVATLSGLQARRLNQRLNYLSRHDALTGAFNRHHFDAFEHQHALAGSQRIGAIMFDCDHFKRVNDTFGHGVGDEVLIQLVQLCKPLLTKENSLIRWGGEEFLLLVVDEAVPLSDLAEQLRRAIADHPWANIAPGLKVTISLGHCRQSVGVKLQEAIRRADVALYRAKANGRNRSEGWRDDGQEKQE
ncbi:sensor domain-containing diguanylate cyclase [Aeromonas tecta]|uniref:sensor domain-containing diguanylate cyclase n=1 Tax=Aeromonas tecta TaxID=324617 RepID=UPI0006831CC6|nr:sensor domain-containing diguanylate cyclase [Aeromonas tecta]